MLSNSKDKEQRWMKDQDHKVSRAIANFPKENKISVIRLEKLANIKQRQEPVVKTKRICTLGHSIDYLNSLNINLP